MPSEVKDLELGFVGNRKPRRESMPVKILPNKAWGLCKEKVVLDGVQMKAT